MGKAEFETFLKNVSKHETNEIDWKKRREDWLEQVDRFYQKIQEWLEKYGDKGKIELRFCPITLNEDYIGSYETRKLYLKIADKEVVFEPVGTLLISARGRIDMIGTRGKVRFVLVDKDSIGISINIRTSTQQKPQKNEKVDVNGQFEWKISTPPPSIKYIDLTEDSFFDVLMEVLNG